MAIWIAILLTPPPDPTTITVSPALKRALWISMRQAVRLTKSGAAAAGKSKPSGLAARFAAGTARNSAAPPHHTG
ncbi:MAG: hypothetical protein WBR24_09250 [Desulfobacterales bacterium]